MNNHIGEILLVNARNRTAIVLNETDNKVIEVPLLPKCRDDDILANTSEDIPKEGSKVQLGYHGNDFVVLGPATRVNYQRQVDALKIQRKLIGVNEGNPFYYGIVQSDLSPQDGFNSKSGELFGGLDQVYKKNEDSNYSFSGNSYDDVMPGDKYWATKDGNAIGVLEGGISLFKASELCQIIGIRYDDLLRIVSRNYEHFTDFGNITCKNENGNTSYVIEGSASAKDVKAGRYSLRVELGSAGDLIKLQVRDGEGSEISKFHMKSDGNIELRSNNFTNLTYGNLKEIVYGERIVDMRGKYVVDYKDDYSKTIHGSEERSITNNRVHNIQNDVIESVGRNITKNVAGLTTETVFGSASGDAVNKTIFVGNKRELISTTGNFVRETTAGDFTRETLLGGFSEKCTLGNYDIEVNGGDLNISVNNVGSGGNINIEGGVSGVLNSIKMDAFGGITIEDTNLNKVEMTSSGIKASEIGGATLNLSATKVALGNAAEELLALVDEFLAEVSTTEQDISVHIHPTVVGPTALPTNSAAFIAHKVVIDLIKTRLAIIKGSI
jgi:hypothetical protein